jgi:hypothetical protein
MNAAARADLLRALEHMQQHSLPLSMLVITIRTTSKGLLAGMEGSNFSLDYPHAGWVDVVRTHRFASFCRTKGFPLQKKKWGNERVSSASIGRLALDAVETIDECFTAVYHETGPFGLELRELSWRPSAGP